MTVHHHDERAEAAVLSCLLLDPAAIDEVSDLAPEHFTSPRWRTCWQAVQRLHRAGLPIEVLPLRSELVAMGRLEQVGDDALAGLMEGIPSPLDVDTHAQRIRHHALVRAVVDAARQVLVRGSQPVEDAQAFALEAEALMARAAQSHGQAGGPVDMRTAIAETVEELAVHAERVRDGHLAGSAIPTRFAGLNRKLGGGYRGAELHIVAARPGMGKTALGLDLALSLGRHVPGVMFSLEMARGELVRRALASEGRIDGGRLRTAQLSADDWDRLQRTGGDLAAIGVHIDDTPGTTLQRVRSVLRRQAARGGLGWCVIDYVGLMQGERGVKREEQIGEISRGLKRLAKELQIPVIALAQLNREVERRTGKDRRPQLADLRDTGSLEQDADVVVFIHREELYQRENPDLRGKAEIIIGKQRGGPTGTIHCRYFHEWTRFEELADEDHGASGDRSAFVDDAPWPDDEGVWR